MSRQSNRDTDKPYVLSKKDAWALLAAVSDYVHTPNRTIDGKERADILADAALAQGLSDVSNTIASVHSSVMRFHKGDYQAIQHLLEVPAFRYLRADAAKTSFATAAEQQFASLSRIAELGEKIGGREIDWEESSKVLLSVKKKRFPEDLTMIEKLTLAQSLSSAGRE